MFFHAAVAMIHFSPLGTSDCRERGGKGAGSVMVVVVVGGGGGDPLPTGGAALVHLQLQLGVQASQVVEQRRRVEGKIK